MWKECALTDVPHNLSKNNPLCSLGKCVTLPMERDRKEYTIYCTITGGSTLGVEGRLIQVEVDISDGLPGINMVGLLSSEVKEAGERVRTALKNTGYSIPPKRITVSLTPADEKKQGSSYDLPIAAAILANLGSFPVEQLNNRLMIGELGLNGAVRPVKGVLAIVLEAKRLGITRCILPKENAGEGSLAGEGMEITGVENLKQLCGYLSGEICLPAQQPVHRDERQRSRVDFSEINGQRQLRRAAEIAAAGMHNLLMVGPPGSGKTMAARRIPTILPPMSEEESLELTKIYSAAGLLSGNALIRERPFRAPHHNATAAALIGGGSVPKPGEVTLAAHGVLFLDELPEFSRGSLEAMRQPLEDRVVLISRARASCSFPADFMLVAAMNPCRCGYYPDRNRCLCSERDIISYQGRVSQPFMDRMDLVVNAEQPTYSQLRDSRENESSERIRQRVVQAHRIQKERYQRESICYNSQLLPGQIERYCPVGRGERRLLEQIYQSFQLTGRGYFRILRTARTIADLEGSQEIKKRHISEAVMLRQRRKGAE